MSGEVSIKIGAPVALGLSMAETLRTLKTLREQGKLVEKVGRVYLRGDDGALHEICVTRESVRQKQLADERRARRAAKRQRVG